MYNPQHELVSYLKSKGIVAQAYSPLGSVNSPLHTDEVVTSVAAKHSLQVSDVLIGYLGSFSPLVLPFTPRDPAHIHSQSPRALLRFRSLSLPLVFCPT